VGDFDRAEDKVFECADEQWRVADSGHHAETLDAPFFGIDAAINVDLVKSFDVLGDEGDGHNEGFLHAFVAEAFEAA